MDDFTVKPASKSVPSDGFDDKDNEQKAPFVPQYVFEALKENKRFDSMRVRVFSVSIYSHKPRSRVDNRKTRKNF